MVSGTKKQTACLVLLVALAPLTRAQEFPFEDVTSGSGIDRHASTYDAAAADFDHDGDPDIFVANHGEVPAFYVNQGNGQFVDRAPLWGLKSEDWHGFGFTDLNADGFADLLVCSGAQRGEGRGPNRISLNLRGRSFAPLVHAPEPLADAAGRHRSLICRDLDLNGLTDYVFLNYASPNGLVLNLDHNRFVDAAAESGLREFPGVVAAVTGCMVHLNADHYLDLVAPGYPPVLVFGIGPARFGTPVTTSLVTRISNAVAITHGDIDNDGDEDLYVTRGIRGMDVVAAQGQRIAFELHGRGQTDPGLRFSTKGITHIDAEILFEGHENAPHRFLGAAGEHPSDKILSFTPADWPRLRGRPKLDADAYGALVFLDDQDRFTLELAAGGRQDESLTGRLTLTGTVPPIERYGTWVDKAPELTNRLLLNDGAGQFTDVTLDRGAGDAQSGRMSVIADFDNDGDLDIFVLNNAPFLKDEPDAILWNDGRGAFTRVESTIPPLENGAGRPSSALALDYDLDGYLDLFITNGDEERPFNKGPYQLWHNRGSRGHNRPGHWLMVQLLGGSQHECNGLGSRLALELRHGKTLWRNVDGGNTLYSQSLLPTHFGLGSDTAKRLRVIWPNGKEQIVAPVPADRVLLVRADQGAAPSRESAWYYVIAWGVLGALTLLARLWWGRSS